MRRVEVTMHSEAGQWWADSTDVEHFTAVADSLGELRKLAKEGLEFYLNESEIELDESVVFEDALVGVPGKVTSWYSQQIVSVNAMQASRTNESIGRRQLIPVLS